MPLFSTLPKALPAQRGMDPSQWKATTHLHTPYTPRGFRRDPRPVFQSHVALHPAQHRVLDNANVRMVDPSLSPKGFSDFFKIFPMLPYLIMKEIKAGIFPTTFFYPHTLSAPLGKCSLSHNWHCSPLQELYFFCSS